MSTGDAAVPEEIAMSSRRVRLASIVAALAAFPFAPFAAAGEDDPQPVVSASVEGDSTISGVPEGEVLWDQRENCTILATSSRHVMIWKPAIRELSSPICCIARVCEERRGPVP